MSNASDAARPGQADVPETHPSGGRDVERSAGGFPQCPLWCVRHGDSDLGTPDAFRIHYGAVWAAGGRSVRLWRGDDIGAAGVVSVLLDDEELEGAEASELAELLTEAATSAGPAPQAPHRHATWCDPDAHAQAARERLSGHQGCVGRHIYVKVGGREVGGWWRQEEGEDPYFAAEWQLRFAELSPSQLLSLYGLFLSMSWSDVNSITTMLGQALDAYEGGDAWRDTVKL